MPSELTKTYVPSFDEFVEDPDKWLSQLDGYNTEGGENPQAQAQAQITNEDENAAAPGDVQVGNAQPTIPGSEAGVQGAGSDNGWGASAGGSQPIGGQMAQDNAGAIGAQTPVQGAQPGADQAGFGGSAQPGTQTPVQGSPAGTAPAQPGAQETTPPVEPGSQTTPPAEPNAQEEDKNKQTPPAPAATGF